MHAEKCPVCGTTGGWWTYQIPPYNTWVYPPEWQSCHGCDGKGWVVVPDEPKEAETPKTWAGIPIIEAPYLGEDEWMFCYPPQWTYRINEHHDGDELSPISYWEANTS